MRARRHGNGHFVLFACPIVNTALQENSGARDSGARDSGARDSGAAQNAAPRRELSRLGLAVAKTAGHSPARARLRRLFREAFRCIRSELAVPTDLVALLRQPWPAADLAAVVTEMRHCAHVMRLLR